MSDKFITTPLVGNEDSPLLPNSTYIFVDPTNGHIMGDTDRPEEIEAYHYLKETEKFFKRKLVIYKRFYLEGDESIDSMMDVQPSGIELIKMLLERKKNNLN